MVIIFCLTKSPPEGARRLLKIFIKENWHTFLVSILTHLQYFCYLHKSKNCNLYLFCSKYGKYLDKSVLQLKAFLSDWTLLNSNDNALIGYFATCRRLKGFFVPRTHIMRYFVNSLSLPLGLYWLCQVQIEKRLIHNLHYLHYFLLCTQSANWKVKVTNLLYL